jgi:hypothetical protein
MRENSPKNIGQCQLGDNRKIEKKKRKMSKKEEGKTKDYEKLKLTLSLRHATIVAFLFKALLQSSVTS